MRSVLIAVVVVVTACADSPWIYSTEPGYSDRSLGNAKHVVFVCGGPTTAGATLNRFADRRAKELCPGGWQTSDESVSVDWRCDSKSVTRVIDCGPRRAQPADDTGTNVSGSDRDTAWQLTKVAAEAARAGDCARVKQIDAQVRDLDSELHTTVFLVDAAIVNCLKATAAPPPVAPLALPDKLDRVMITEGIDKVRSSVMACASRTALNGEVKVAVMVHADGYVLGATIKASPDPAVDDCVVAAVKKAKFAPTQVGGSFSIPFNF